MILRPVLVGFASISIAACGSNDASDDSRGEGREIASGTVNTSEGEASYSVRDAGEGNSTVTVAGPDGESATIKTGTSAAEFLPDFAPLYPGATVTGGAGSNAAKSAGGMVSFTAKAEPQKVIDFYKSAAAKAGMKIDAEVTMGESRMLAATNAATNESLQVQVHAADGGTAGTLIAGKS